MDPLDQLYLTDEAGGKLWCQLECWKVRKQGKTENMKTKTEGKKSSLPPVSLRV